MLYTAVTPLQESFSTIQAKQVFRSGAGRWSEQRLKNPAIRRTALEQPRAGMHPSQWNGAIVWGSNLLPQPRRPGYQRISIQPY